MMQLLEQLSSFQRQRMEELQQAYKLLGAAYSSGRLPQLAEVPSNVLLTAAATAALAQVLLLCLSRSGRRAVFLTLDTLAAVALMVLLAAVVLGMPVGEQAGRRRRRCSPQPLLAGRAPAPAPWVRPPDVHSGWVHAGPRLTRPAD
jgi:hypothetical protein